MSRLSESVSALDRIRQDNGIHEIHGFCISYEVIVRMYVLKKVLKRIPDSNASALFPEMHVWCSRVRPSQKPWPFVYLLLDKL